jgi:siroheme synthase (precorrin-2 oxidase/ferrochelatase)
MDALENLANGATLLQASVWLIGAAVAGGGIVLGGQAAFTRKREKRLFKNISRPVAVVATESRPMDHEADLLDKVGLFKIKHFTADPRVTSMLDGYRLIVLGYTPNSAVFGAVFSAAQTKGIPVIVYASPGQIIPQDLTAIQGYTNHAMCNAPMRLVSDTFAIMSTFPEGK